MSPNVAAHKNRFRKPLKNCKSLHAIFFGFGQKYARQWPRRAVKNKKLLFFKYLWGAAQHW
jgi:hypothetical protein